MEEAKNGESPKKIIEPLITVPKPRPSQIHQQQQQQQQQQQKNNNSCPAAKLGPGVSKYTELLHVIEELGQHVRPSYAGHRGSAEKIRQGIMKSRILVRECLVETEKSAARQ